MKALRWPFAFVWTVYVVTPFRLYGIDIQAPGALRAWLSAVRASL